MVKKEEIGRAAVIEVHNTITAFLREFLDRLEALVPNKSKEGQLLAGIIRFGPILPDELVEKIKVKSSSTLSKLKSELNERLACFCAACELNPPIQIYPYSVQVRNVGYHFSCVPSIDNPSKKSGLITLSEIEGRLKKAIQILVKNDLDHKEPVSIKADSRQVLSRYIELALDSCNIIDLSVLPQYLSYVPMNKVLMRKLYIPLRLRIEIAADVPANSDQCEKMEKRRNDGRQWDNAQLKDERVKANTERLPIGERLAQWRRLVVLGDPGSGKTTLVRWLATAYLLRLKGDPEAGKLRDVETLPCEDWLPLIVRGRELYEAHFSGSLDAVFLRTFRALEMTPNETRIVMKILRERMVEGKVLLLFDGLDEIPDHTRRATFCRQIERLIAAYPLVPIVATSRVVGYQELGFRVGSAFEVTTVAELTREDKNSFARCWSEVMEPEKQRANSTLELRKAIFFSAGVERLTNNPLLLTIVALMKHELGELPQRRCDLYARYIELLLKWRSEIYDPIDRREALPQLEYIAYAMCKRGIQRLDEDQLLDLLVKMRSQCQVGPTNRHSPEEFLSLLKRQTGIIVEVGTERRAGLKVPVYEFRHLSFQEYLAGLAVMNGHFFGCDGTRNLSEYIVSLAKTFRIYRGGLHYKYGPEYFTCGPWLEPIRLCVASCGQEDADAVLKAVVEWKGLDPHPYSERRSTIVAILCLADEPDVSNEVGTEILQHVWEVTIPEDIVGPYRSALRPALAILAGSKWGRVLQELLIDKFKRGDLRDRDKAACMCGYMGFMAAYTKGLSFQEWFENRQSPVMRDKEEARIETALTIMTYLRNGNRIPSTAQHRVIEMLLSGLEGSQAEAAAMAVTLLHVQGRFESDKFITYWELGRKDVGRLINYLARDDADTNALICIFVILRRARSKEALDVLIAKLGNKTASIRQAAAITLSVIKDQRAVRALKSILDDKDCYVRKAALGSLMELRGDKIDIKLISPFFADLEICDQDPMEVITEKQVERDAKRLKLPLGEVRRRIEILAQEFGLKLEWMQLKG